MIMKKEMFRQLMKDRVWFDQNMEITHNIMTELYQKYNILIGTN